METLLSQSSSNSLIAYVWVCSLFFYSEDGCRRLLLNIANFTQLHSVTSPMFTTTRSSNPLCLINMQYMFGHSIYITYGKVLTIVIQLLSLSVEYVLNRRV
jgi:hypothetical protein